MKIKDFKLIEIEISSFCNRTCRWCPNSFINRSKANIMDINNYLDIMKELRDADYSGYITYSRYNEPFADIDLLLSRLSIAKELVPKATLVTNTNGDYLTNEVLEDVSSYLSELSIMDYDNNYAKYIDLFKDRDYHMENGFITFNVNNMKCLIYCNWSKRNVNKLNNRGGALIHEVDRDFIRTVPCYEPSRFIGIDYNGSVMPCCEVRSDFNIGGSPINHKEYILGNVFTDTLESIINSDKAIKFRQTAIEAKDLPPACKHCKKTCGRYTREHSGIEY